MADKSAHIHDELLGYVPRAGLRGSGSGGVSVTIDADSLRVNGSGPASNEGAILAVGDSYTFGEDVGDAETWPAQLQKLTGRRVLNGGVSGYGFDQIVLRAEQLAAVHAPSIVIASFIAADVQRTEMYRLWGYDKPWFECDGDGLALRGVPVPDHTLLSLPARRRIERVLFELPYFLQRGLSYHKRAHRAGSGREIACRLAERLARLQGPPGPRVVVLAQYDPHAWIERAFANEQRALTKPVLDCAAAHGVATLDSFARLAAEPRPRDFYGTYHMNARGNLLIARLLAATLPALLKG